MTTGLASRRELVLFFIHFRTSVSVNPLVECVTYYFALVR